MTTDGRRNQYQLPLNEYRAKRNGSISKPVAEPRQLRTVGLFAGIGGIEAGLESAGHQTRLLCELDRGACAVLEDRFPGVPIHTDICTLEDVPRGTDLIAGGFPCQDLSQAGQTRGISGAQSGLVHQVFRLLEKRRVPWVLLENVPFMLQLAQGRALEVVVENLERLGYSWAYRVVETRAFGLPQRRQRVFFLASLEEDPRRVLFSHEVEPPMEPAYDPENRPACGFYWTEGVRGLGWAVDAVPTLKGGSTVGVPSPPAIWLPSDQIVTPSIGDAERLQGFRKHWTKPAEAVVRRGARWKMVGNAVTVPVAKWVGERLAQPTDFELGLERRLHDGGRWPHAAWNVGEGRFTAHVSSWPVRKKRRPLAEFLKDEPTLLSHRATAGFLERTTRGSLRFPIGFLDAVARHRERMAKSNEEKVVVG